MFGKRIGATACPAREARLEDYIERRLSADEAAEVETHARSCARCAAALDAAGASVPLLGMLRARPQAQPSPYFVARVMAAVRGEQDVWKPVERAAWRLCWVATAVVLILAAFLLHLQRLQPIPPAPEQSQVQALVSVSAPQPAYQDDSYLLVSSGDHGR